MFGLIEGICSFTFGMVKLGAEIAWGAVEFVFGLLGGLLSLVLTLGGILLAGALILLVIFRRKEYRKRQSQPYADNQTRTYDVDQEEFTSFYDQFRTQE